MQHFLKGVLTAGAFVLTLDAAMAQDLAPLNSELGTRPHGLVRA